MRDTNLNKIAKKREQMLNDAIMSIGNIETKNSEYESIIQKYKVEEIKYKTTINELNDMVEIYKAKLEEMTTDDEKSDKEIIRLRKTILKQETEISNLKTILGLFVNEYGIEKVIELTKIDEKIIESYLGWLDE